MPFLFFFPLLTQMQIFCFYSKVPDGFKSISFIDFPPCADNGSLIMVKDLPSSETSLLFSCLVVSNSFATPWSVVHQAPPLMGFPRQEYQSGLPFLTSGDLPSPGIEPRSPVLAGRFFTTEPPLLLFPKMVFFLQYKTESQCCYIQQVRNRPLSFVFIFWGSRVTLIFLEIRVKSICSCFLYFQKVTLSSPLVEHIPLEIQENKMHAPSPDTLTYAVGNPAFPRLARG